MSLTLKILLCVVVLEVLGGLGAVVTSGEVGGWYAALERPLGTPPNAVFGPVWSVLYALMGVALALVWHRVPKGRRKRQALGWFGVQLLLNLAWTPVFFGLHQMFMALVILLALQATIVVTVLLFRRIEPLAAVLMLPYLLWVTYATYLNAGYWVLNR